MFALAHWLRYALFHRFQEFFLDYIYRHFSCTISLQCIPLVLINILNAYDALFRNLCALNRLGFGRLWSDCKVDEGDLSKLGLSSLTLVEIQHNDGMRRIFAVCGLTGYAVLKLSNQIFIFVVFEVRQGLERIVIGMILSGSASGIFRMETLRLFLRAEEVILITGFDLLKKVNNILSDDALHLHSNLSLVLFTGVRDGLLHEPLE